MPVTGAARRGKTGFGRTGLRLLPAGIALAAAACPAAAEAETIWTLPGAGSWTTPSNWSTAAVPDLTTSVRIDNGGEAQVTMPGATAAGLTIGGAAASSGALTVTAGGTLTTTSATPSIIGQNGAGTITISRVGSAWTNAGGLIVGDAAGSRGAIIVDMGATVTTGTAAGTTTIFANQAGSVGSLSVDGAGTLFAAANTLILGNGGSATLRVSSGGTVTNNGAVLGASTGGSGAATITGLGSSWQTTGLLTLGRSGSASLMVEAAAEASADDLTAGLESGGSAAVKVSGAGSALSVTDELTLGASGSGDLTVESGGAVTADTVTLGANAGGVGSAKITGSGSSLQAATELTLGASGDGALTVEAGGSVTAATLQLGAESTGRGSLVVTGTGSTVAADRLTVGETGTGSVTIEAGASMTGDSATIGDKSGSRGAVLVNGTGSTWQTTGEVTIGADGSGSLSVVGAGAASSATATVGAHAGGTGSVIVSGSGSSWSTDDAMTIGAEGTGTVAVSLGAAVSAGTMAIGTEAGGNGAVLVTDNGSTLSASDSLTVGAAGTGALTLANGGTAGTGNLAIGTTAGGTGTVTVTNLGSNLAVDGKATIGGAGTATLTIASAGTMTSGATLIGAAAGSSGLVKVTGAGSDWQAGTLTIGAAGSGTVQVTAAGTLESGAATLGALSGSTGAVTIDGGGSVWTVDGDLVVGNGGQGTLLLSAQGVAEVGGGTGTVTLAAEDGSSGTLQIGSGGGAGSLAAAEITGGAGTALVVLDHNELGYQLTPLISGSASLSQVGSGSTVLTALNTYTGATTITAGTLQAGGTNVFSQNSAVTVASGGMLDLAGFSQILPSLSNAGTVSLAGTTAGTTLAVTGNYAGNGGTLVLAAVLAGDDSPADRLAVAGDVSGQTTLAVTNLGGTGAKTTGDGIKVVSVDGASPADAFQATRTIAGAYDYRLFQGGVGADAGDGDWYLRSDTSLAAQTYAAYPATLVNFGLASIGTYRQRTGVWTYGAVGATVGDAWIRGAGSWSDATPDNGSPYEQGLQFGQAGIGAELPVMLATPGDLAAGVMATLGRSSSTVTASTHGVAGSGTIDTNAYGIGANLTWSGTSGATDGLYADAVAQVTWFETGFDASDTGSLSSGNGAIGGAFSLEVGKWIELSKGWAVVPQGQLVYASVGGDGFSDRDGTRIDDLSGDSLVGRAGVRLEHSGFLGGGVADTARLNAYILANLAYAMTGSYAISVGDTQFSNDDAALMGELGLGATLQMNANAALYGEASYAAAASGGSDQRWSGNLGFRFDW